MDRAKQKKIRNIRVILTNIFMSVSVVAIVFVLMLIAMGFSFNESGRLEQSGLLQLNSRPSGASVEIDKSTQFGHTDFSKMLSSGNHYVYVDKSGYDHWEQTIKIDPGLLTRVEWIRLFPSQPVTSQVQSFDALRLAKYSPDRRWLIAIEQGSDKLLRINIQNEKLEQTSLNLTTLLGANASAVTEGELAIHEWSENCAKFIASWTNGDTTRWYLFDLEHPENSINLTKQYAKNFTDVQLANHSASKLWLLADGSIYLADLGNLSISDAVATGVKLFAHNRETISYAKQDGNKLVLSLYKNGEKGATELLTLTENAKDAQINLAMGTHWNEEWIAYTVNKTAVILDGRYPSFGKNESDKLKQKYSQQLNYEPKWLSVNRGSRIIVFAGEKRYISYDIETNDSYDVSFEKSTLAGVNWIDDYLLYHNNEGKLVIRDFDGSNRRTLAKKLTDQPAIISENNHWLYYFSATDEKVNLKRINIE